ncbi:MAG: hypothetical protein V4543_14100 [Bacteroidota bacterium]
MAILLMYRTGFAQNAKPDSAGSHTLLPTTENKKPAKSYSAEEDKKFKNEHTITTEPLAMLMMRVSMGYDLIFSEHLGFSVSGYASPVTYFPDYFNNRGWHGTSISVTPEFKLYHTGDMCNPGGFIGPFARFRYDYASVTKPDGTLAWADMHSYGGGISMGIMATDPGGKYFRILFGPGIIYDVSRRSNNSAEYNLDMHNGFRFSGRGTIQVGYTFGW